MFDTSVPELMQKLRSLRDNVVWHDAQSVIDFVHNFDAVICNWAGQPPSLLAVFPKEELDILLVIATNAVARDEGNSRAERAIIFLAASGYVQDRPDGSPFGDGPTPIHLLARKQFRNRNIVLARLFHIFNNFARNNADSAGFTHFHAACSLPGGQDIVQLFLGHGHNVNLRINQTADTPLHYALASGGPETVDLLLRHGADHNALNVQFVTPLHVACHRNTDDSACAEVFFRFVDALGCVASKVQLDAVESTGSTPLHLALRAKNWRAAEWLLRRGANPNQTHAEGWHALHMICQNRHTFLDAYFSISKEMGKPAWVNIQDREGNTPLHTALLNREQSTDRVVRTLMCRGADPNWQNRRLMTPLHVLCQRGADDHALAKSIIDMSMRPVRNINARDGMGRTPLQWAVANLMVNVVELLLNRGVTLADFVFPTMDYFGAGFSQRLGDDVSNMKLRQASGALGVLDCLEKKGYQLKRSDVRLAMNLFDRFGLFEKTGEEFNRDWYDDEVFTNMTKQIIVKRDEPGVEGGLSLYDLSRMTPYEASRRLTYKDYFEFQRPDFYWVYYRNVDIRPFELHLCEKLSRGFFWRWTVEPLRRLAGYKLSSSCCKRIMRSLKNMDLYHIFCAGTSQDYQGVININLV